VPDARVEVHLGKGEAAVDFSMELTDWVTIPNSLNPAHPLGSSPATISLHIVWSGIDRTINFSDADIGYRAPAPFTRTTPWGSPRAARSALSAGFASGPILSREAAALARTAGDLS